MVTFALRILPLMLALSSFVLVVTTLVVPVRIVTVLHPYPSSEGTTQPGGESGSVQLPPARTANKLLRT
jgi:hypothetical protein